MMREGRGKEERGKLALVVASLMKLFLRELAEPLVPYGLYGQCVKAAAAAAAAARPPSNGDGERKRDSALSSAATAACLALVSPDNEAQMPALNRRCLLYLVALLQCFLEPEAIKATGVDARTLASLLSPALLRPPPWSAGTGMGDDQGNKMVEGQGEGAITPRAGQGVQQINGSAGVGVGGNADAQWESVFVYQLLVAWDVERVNPEFVPKLTTPSTTGEEGSGGGRQRSGGQARREV